MEYIWGSRFEAPNGASFVARSKTSLVSSTEMQVYQQGIPSLTSTPKETFSLFLFLLRNPSQEHCFFSIRKNIFRLKGFLGYQGLDFLDSNNLSYKISIHPRSIKDLGPLRVFYNYPLEMIQGHLFSELSDLFKHKPIEKILDL